MEKELILHILGLEELNGEDAVRSAYMQKLKMTNPEDDPEGFRRLREAYDEALKLLREAEEEGQEHEKTEIDLWIDRVDEVYKNFRTRADVEAWKELLADPVCEGLDTSLEAREAMIVYLLSHFYLPREIWQCLDQEFQIVEDIEELKERFPADFLDYVKHYVENEYYIDFSRMSLREGASMENVNVDAYIKADQELRSTCDQGDWKKAMQLADEMEAYGVYYPWEGAERLRIQEGLYQTAKEASEMNEKSEAAIRDRMERDARKLAEENPDMPYILAKAGNVMWTLGDHETAFRWWQQGEANYQAKYGMIRYYLEDKGDAQKAKDLAEGMLDRISGDSVLDDYLKRANEILIREYEEKVLSAKSEEERQEALLEGGWCYFQNKNLDRALEILEELDAAEGGLCENLYYSYHNMKGRLLASMSRYKEAEPELQLWLSLILETEDDGSDEMKRRLRRKGSAYFMLGWCKYQLEKYEEAAEDLKKAEGEIQDVGERLSCMNSLAQVYLAKEEFEKAVDQCDRIIAQERNYYPAYLARQEAYYKMQRSQQVVDDYYQAIEIYAGYYKPYLLAAKVFFFCHQYEDAKGVLDRAAENKVEFSDELKLYQVKILRNLAENEEDRAAAMELCRQLQESFDPKETDLEDQSEPEYEIALLLWDDNDLDEALKHLQNAIRRNPNRLQYFMVRGEIQRGKGDYKAALLSYATAKEDYDETAGYYYGIGCCYQEQNREEDALKQFLKAAEIDNRYRDVTEKIADIYMERYKSWSRPEDFEKAIEYVNLEVENWRGCYTLIHRGLMYMEAMRLEEALADFEEALTYREDDWAGYNNMGYCYKHLSQFDKGIEVYQKSVECLEKYGSKNLLPYSNMADCFELKRDYQSAINCYLRDLEWFPDRKSFFLEIGDLYRYLGEYKKAIEYYKKEGLNDNEYQIRIGDVFCAKGDRWRAERTWKQAAEKASLDYRYERYVNYAERMMDNLGNPKAAIKIMERAEQMRESGNWKAGKGWQAACMKYLARAHYLLEESEKAAGYAKKGIELYLEGFRSEEEYLSYLSRRPGRLSNIGQCYLYMGEREKAMDYFDQMEAGLRCKTCREPKCYEAYLNRGRCYMREKRWQEALEAFEEAQRILSSERDLEVVAMLKKIRKEIR